jgi:hypothetical protein
MSDTEDKQVTLDLPGMIDGDPFEVERQVLSTLPPILDEFASFIDDVCAQLANTERSRILRQNKAMNAEELAEHYEASDRAGQLVRFQGAAKALCSAAAELEED